jgi:DNA polymerase III epsilon subunit-like protein
MPKEFNCQLCWLDIETTGLNPHFDYILEVAMVATDWDLNVLGEAVFPVLPTDPKWADRMSEYVREMHTKNGLIGNHYALVEELEPGQWAAWLDGFRQHNGPELLEYFPSREAAIGAIEAAMCEASRHLTGGR